MTQPTPSELAPIVRNPADLRLPEAMLSELILRRTLVDVRTSFAQLSSALGITISVAEALMRELREKKLVDFERMIGHDWVIGLTDAGKAQAIDSLRKLSYVGTVPVPLDHYRHVVLAQRFRPHLNREMVKAAYRDVVIDDALVEAIGPAMMSDGAMFLYGPPGTGKSTVAERLARLMGAPVLIPRAIEVDNQIVTVYDPTVHNAIDPQPEIDKRFVLCARPAIIVGGELERGQLDLTYDPNSGLHLAPVQLKANNGVLVIDDFGRQLMSPTELLNRWIVPMDRSIDYLTLNYGVRFHVPFDVRVVFSTNLDPQNLGDEAFFRRIPNKVYVGSITDAQFDVILQVLAGKSGLALDAREAAHLRQLVRQRGDGDLRPYLPGVVCKLARAICQFEGLPLRLDTSVLDRVADMYFTRTDTPKIVTKATAAGGPPKPTRAVPVDPRLAAEELTPEQFVRAPNSQPASERLEPRPTAAAGAGNAGQAF
jgi:Mn-dependent DtxR family transcriptional regulator